MHNKLLKASFDKYEAQKSEAIAHLDILFKNWIPRKRFDLIKLEDKSIPTKFNQHPISLTPEFLKEIQSI